VSTTSAPPSELPPPAAPLLGAGDRRARDLRAQISWFLGLRFAAVAGVATATGAAHWLGSVVDPWPLWALAAATLTCNLAYTRWVRAHAGAPAPALRRHVDLQIAVDLLLLTAMLHYSGGITNPFVCFYLFHGFIAALVLSVRAATLVAAVSLLLVATLGFGEWTGLLPHHPIRLGLFSLSGADPVAIAIFVGALGLTYSASIYFVSTIVQRLRASEAELVTLSRQLAMSEKLAAIGTLAAGVSHEINNPVAVIQSKVDVLRYRIADRDPPEALLAELGAIEKHGRRIGAITAGLLAFARETPFELRPLGLNAVVEEGIDLVRLPYQRAGLLIEQELDPSAPRIAGSQNHLLQVLVNVLLNARDASRSGGRVWIRTQADGPEVRLSIRDEGEGIQPQHLAKIFDPFFTTKDVDRGTGLGLAISHGIVERHGGRIEVESRPGAGSTFTIVLPRDQDAGA
jgi:signal transduction histidine kinase